MIPQRAAPLASLLLIGTVALGAEATRPNTAQLVKQLAGPNALAEWRAGRKLVAQGDAAVPALEQLAGSTGPLAPRLVAVELLGEIATPKARDALVALLAKERKALAVRGQLCMQLGYLREARAIPAIAEWLGAIGPRSLHDVRAPKEALPSTVYARHAEALGMIGDPRAIPILETFAKKLPKGVGYGGFISNFVAGAAQSAIADLKENAAFWEAVRKQPGLEAKLAPLFDHFRTDRVAAFRHHEREVVGGTPQGRTILRDLAASPNSPLADAAKALLTHYGNRHQ